MIFQPNAVGPGPAHDTYMMNQYGKHRVPGGRFAGLPRGLQWSKTPGPADYCVVSARGAAGYKMVRPGRPRDPASTGPAPNEYCPTDALRGPAVYMGRRYYAKEKAPTPGPGQYDVPRADLYMPARYREGLSMGRRPADGRKAITPGPADYYADVRPNCCRCAKNGVCRITFGMRRPDTVPAFAVHADNKIDC